MGYLVAAVCTAGAAALVYLLVNLCRTLVTVAGLTAPIHG